MDKFTTYLFLQKYGIPTPATVLLSELVDTSRIVNELDFPQVFKVTRSARGHSVAFIDNKYQLDELITLYQSVSNKGSTALVQRCCAKSIGKDIRVYVIRGKVFTAYERDSAGKSNVALGGVARAVDIDPQMSKIIEQTCQALELSIGGVDLLYGEHGYEVSEVNLAALFDGGEKATGLNIARETLCFLLEEASQYENYQ